MLVYIDDRDDEELSDSEGYNYGSQEDYDYEYDPSIQSYEYDESDDGYFK